MLTIYNKRVMNNLTLVKTINFMKRWKKNIENFIKFFGMNILIIIMFIFILQRLTHIDEQTYVINPAIIANRALIDSTRAMVDTNRILINMNSARIDTNTIMINDTRISVDSLKILVKNINDHK